MDALSPLSLYLIKNHPNLNPNSPKQLAAYFESQGLVLPRTDPTEKSPEGNPSTGTEALQKVDHPLARTILEYRGLKKLLSSYIEPLIELLVGYKNNPEYIKVYPEIQIFGASQTGRCSASNPNIQNIPTRKAMGNRIRTIFHPLEGEKMASLDYSGQELRLIVHVSHLYQLPGAKGIVEEFLKNPDFDMHQIGADILGVKRSAAKEFVLGIPYGLWHTTMAEKLKIPLGEAERHRKTIIEHFPFLDRVAKKTKKLVEDRGYIRDISGRYIYLDFSRKALNAAIQGSAAYQTNKAIVDCYRAGIIIIAPIHDELLISYSNELYLSNVKQLMVDSVKLEVPTVVNVKTGYNWGEMK